MAARLNRRHSEMVLERISLSNLVTRLQKNALRQLRNPHNPDEIVMMTEGEIRSAIFLIERRLAKAEAIKHIEHGGTVTLAQMIAGVIQDEQADADATVN